MSVLLHPAILWFGFQADGLVRHPRVHQTADRHTDRFPLPLLSVSVSLSGVIRNEKMHIWSPCWSVLPENDVFSGALKHLLQVLLIRHMLLLLFLHCLPVWWNFLLLLLLVFLLQPALHRCRLHNSRAFHHGFSASFLLLPYPYAPNLQWYGFPFSATILHCFFHTYVRNQLAMARVFSGFHLHIKCEPDLAFWNRMPFLPILFGPRFPRLL